MNTFKKEIDFHQFNQHNKNSKRTKIVNECLKKASNPKELTHISKIAVANQLSKTKPPHELNNLFHCSRIDENNVSTPVSSNKMNDEKFHWLQLDGICMIVFHICIKWKVAPLHPMSSPALVIKYN